MALPAYQSTGTVGTGTTSVTPGLPASLATGDGCLIVVVCKPDTATIVTPTGWTLVSNVAGGGGSSGNGTGPSQQAWFFREKDATWSTMPAITVTGGSRTASAAFRYTKTAGTVWDIAATSGVYGVGATTTNASTTMGSNPGLTANDAVIGCFTEQAGATTASLESWTATGVSAWGTVTERADATIASTTNPQVGSVVFTGSVTTGTATAAPVMNGTISAASRGTAAMIRLREITLTTVSATDGAAITVTEAPSRNLAIDPSFEDATVGSGWILNNGTLAKDTTHVFDGAKSFKVTSTVENWGYYQPNGGVGGGGLTYKVADNTVYTFSLYVYTDTAQNLCLINYGAPNVQGPTYAVPANTWTRLDVTFTASPSTNFISFRNPNRTTPIAGNIWFDALQIETGSTLSPYTSSGGLVDASFSTTDTAAITITGTTSVSGTMSTTDTAAVTISDASSLSGNFTPVSGSESTAVTISETSSVSVSISTTDTAAITAVEGPGTGGGATTITQKNITGSTANFNTYTTSSFTPTAGEALVVVVHATGSVATDATLTASANGLTFSVIGSPLVHTLSGNVTYFFIANQFVPSSPSTMTVTFDCTSDFATGAFIEVASVAGLASAGTAAVQQTAFSPNLGANAAWTATFASAVNTNNAVLGAMAYTGGATVSPPSGLTELVQPADQVTPAAGFEAAYSNSGLTGTTYTWTSSLGSPTNNTRANVGAIELISGSGTAGQVVVSTGSNNLSSSEDTAVTIDETSDVVNVQGTTDTAAITISETSSVVISLSTTDSCAITITGSVATAGSSTSTDTTAITIAESRTLAGSSTSTDSCAVTITETSAVVNTQNTTDTAAITISETSAPLVSLSTTDSCAITITEARSTAGSSTSTDTTAVTIAETSAVANTQSTTDTAAITIAETSSVVGTVSTTDTAAVTIAETSSVAGTVSTTDTAAITIAELSSIADFSPGSETTSISIAETSSVSAVVSTTDSVAVTITEATGAVQAGPSTTDTSAITIAESRTLNGSSTSTDTCAVTITEVSSVLATFSTTDTTAVTISESSNVGIVTALATTDTTAITMTESPSAIVNAPSTTDTTAVTIAESRTLAGSSTSTDTTAVTIAETRTVTGSSTSTDSCAITISEFSSVAVTQATTDTAAITIAETTSSFRTIDTTDTTAVTVTESRAIDSGTPGQETIGVSITEQSSVFITLSTSDTSAVSVSESVAQTLAFATSDTSAVTISEFTAITISKSATDTTAISISDAGSIFVDVPTTVYVYTGGTWKAGAFYIYLNGTWKETTIYSGHNGLWG